MAKQSGLGQRLLAGGYDISGDVQQLQNVHGGPAALDVTDITQQAHARIGGLRDGGLDITVFMDAANAHPVLSALPTADVPVMYLLNPLAIGSPVACCIAKQADYDPTRAASGDLTLKTQFQANGSGLEWALALTAGTRTDTAPANGAPLDGGAATSFGGQAYLQVTAFTGSTVTVTIQHSPDNSSWSALQAFTAIAAAPAAQRAVVPGTTTVNRYLRAVTSGTFTSVTFAAAFSRNPVAGVVF